MRVQGIAPLADDLAALGAVEEAHFAALAAEHNITAAAALDAALAPGGEFNTLTAAYFACVAGGVIHDTGGTAGSSLETVPCLYAMMAEHYAAVSSLHLRVLSEPCLCSEQQPVLQVQCESVPK